MIRSREKQPDLAARVAEHLRRHGTASSHALAERFLKLAVPSEEAATRILRETLEPHGLIYEEGSGWSARGSIPAAMPDRMIAVAFDASGTPVLVEVQGDAVGEPSSPERTRLEAAVCVLLEPRRDSARLIDSLRRRGLPSPGSIVSLRSTVRGGPRIPRRAGLEEICSVLGVGWHDGEDAASTATAMARCLSRAAGWRREPGSEDEPFDPPGAITREMLDALPERPGVYRFFDSEGALLYVGKAGNLRRRVRSYFGARRPGGHGAHFVPRIHRLEHEVLGSELEALLKEARVIARRRPRANVQVAIHERGRSYGESRRQALLIPGASSRDVTVVFVVDGRHAGHVSIGPRGGGMEKAGLLLRRVLKERPPRPASGIDPDTQILASWLARHGDSVSRLDLDSFVLVEDAVGVLRDATRSVLAETGPQVFRSS